MCDKTKYEAINIAQRELLKIQQVNKDFKDKIVYQCEECLKWHIGKNPIFM